MPEDNDLAQSSRSLHEHLDRIEHLVAQTSAHPVARLHLHGGLPAWRRRTAGEARWQVAICTAVAIALQIAVPGRLVVLRPIWIMPALQAALFIAMAIANPGRLNRESAALRTLGLSLAALISFANAWSVAALTVGLVRGTQDGSPGRLLVTGGVIWLTNVIVFGLWYWEFDLGGAACRALGIRQYPDFMFPQMATPDLAPPDWEPAFADYLYLAFTNASAFSPTDVMPMSRWAKLAMTAQSVVSIITVLLVVARAVNILK